MKKRLFILVFLISLCIIAVGCSPKSDTAMHDQSDGMTAELKLEPSQPNTQEETSIHVELTMDNEPVQGASVFYYLTRPDLETPDNYTDIVETDPGTYTYSLLFSMKGTWPLRVDVNYKAKIYTFNFDIPVK